MWNRNFIRFDDAWEVRKFVGIFVLSACLVGWLVFFLYTCQLELWTLLSCPAGREGQKGEEKGGLVQTNSVVFAFTMTSPLKSVAKLSMTVTSTGWQEPFVIDTGGLTYFVSHFLLQHSSLWVVHFRTTGKANVLEKNGEWNAICQAGKSWDVWQVIFITVAKQRQTDCFIFLCQVYLVLY